MTATFVFGLFLAITFFSAGIAIGGTFFSFRKKSERPAAPPAAAPPESETSAALPAAAAPPHPDLDSLARLYRHGPSGRLLIDFNGQLRAIGQDLTPEQHTALSLLMLDIADWLGAPPPPASAPLPLETTPPPASAASAASPPARASSAKPPSGKPMDALRAMNAQRVQSVGQPAEPGTPAGRINLVLQELLAVSPLSHERVEIRDAVGGGVLFVVGGNSYEYIDQIPPGAARDLIQKSIKEWERRSER